jgi:hypothetical protein
MNIEITKQFTGYFTAFVDGVESDYFITITSHPSGTKNKSTYKVMRRVAESQYGAIEVSPKPTRMFCIQMNLHKAKAFLINEIKKDAK